MPNNAPGRIRIRGPEDRLAEFREYARGSGVKWRGVDRARKVREFDCNKFLPPPEDVVQAGYDAEGYDWCIEHWGTKWGACDVNVEHVPPPFPPDSYTAAVTGSLQAVLPRAVVAEILEMAPPPHGLLVYTMWTAWSPLSPAIFQAASQRFPELSFHYCACDIDVGWVFRCRAEGGSIIEEWEGDIWKDVKGISACPASAKAAGCTCDPDCEGCAMEECDCEPCEGGESPEHMTYGDLEEDFGDLLRGTW
jgi:hypothetical protein